MRKSTAIALGAIVLGAIAVRLAPLWSFLYWGSDTAEYFSILRNLVRTGHVPTTYYGWGVTYPYFPGVFFPQAVLVEVGGLYLPAVLNLLVPVIGALAVLPMFLLAARIARDDRIGLFAAAFLAGAIPHAYTTAHAPPATLGHLLALTGLVLFLRLRTDRRAMTPLLLVSGALVFTHHLSLYFFILMVLGAIVIRGLARPWRTDAESRRQVAFAVVLIGGTFAFWFGYATTFRELVLRDVDIQPWWLLFVGFAAGAAVLAGLIAARTRLAWRYRPAFPRLGASAAACAAAPVTLFVIGVVTILSGVPGTSFRVPLAILLSFSASGRKFLDLDQEGIHPNAWLVALLLSAVVGIVWAPRVLIPYRHAEYLMIPFARFAGVGFFRLLDLGGLRARRRYAALALCGGLLLANGLTGIPPPSTPAGWREGTIPAALDPAYWARDHVSGLVVSDHHGSSTVFGFGGINATWDRTRTPFTDPGWDPADFSGIESPSGTKNGTYVWIDRDMEAGVRLTPWEAAVPMDPAVIAKFDNAPFIKVFDNGYARLYWIGWG